MMAANGSARGGGDDPAERVRKASKRKWSARAWWLGLHLYNYGVLVYACASGTLALSASDVVLLAIVAVASIGCYMALQTSSPGYIERSAGDSPSGLESGDAARREDDPLVGDTERLASVVEVLSETGAGEDVRAPLHFCAACQITQPLRVKHCKDCNRCVRQYDHHCDCAGTCVGERNRRKFVLYLCLQTVEAVVLMNYVSEAISLQSSVDEWFRVNAEFLVGWVSVLFVVAITVPLLIYQAFLLSTNQTSWEHARRQSITYLRDLPTDRSPFDRGVLTNCWVFLTGGDANKWVHHEAAAR